MIAGLVLHGGKGPRLAGSYRQERAGWVTVHLAGSPETIGFQHGYWLKPEIEAMLKVERVYSAHDAGFKDPNSFTKERAEAMQLLWPKVPTEYKQELRGIAEGVRAHGSRLTLADVVINAMSSDYGYYRGYHQALVAKAKKGAPKTSGAADHCSAFIATGSATKDGEIVMGHNCWSGYADGSHNNIILDISPSHGKHILMDSFPGHIDSGDDFAVNSAGIMLTETTIDSYVGFDPKGVPEAVRMREAIQYSDNLTDVERWFTEKNNGAYANMWLIGDAKTNEIASLELGLKNAIFHRSSDGTITSCNCPIDAKLTAEECQRDVKTSSNMCSDRQGRWAQLMARDKGKIDAELGKAYLGDHHDAVLGKDGPSLSDLCGHGDVESRKDHCDGPVFTPMGSVQGKVVTSKLARNLSFWARMGHPCGEPFYAAPFLKSHAEFAWEKSILSDMPTQPWVLVKAAR
ncbi:MAG: C45 family autoproteolytic acyltransferase/hydrolase [Fimbriimonas sp.]|nr:C45 family autoproteolytic acyltransferase/hydrolase [Fimbriimonas sp.]